MAIMLCACFIIKFASWVLQNVYVRYHTMLHEFENIYIYIYVKSHTMNKVRTIYSKAQIKCVHSYEKGMYLM